jgi:hypothetical protein
MTIKLRLHNFFRIDSKITDEIPCDRNCTIAGKKMGHQISVSFEKFDVVQALLSFFLTLFQLTV